MAAERSELLRMARAHNLARQIIVAAVRADVTDRGVWLECIKAVGLNEQDAGIAGNQLYNDWVISNRDGAWGKGPSFPEATNTPLETQLGAFAVSTQSAMETYSETVQSGADEVIALLQQA